MATNIDLITAAYRLLGVIGENEAPSAEQGANALGPLNRMIEAWTEDDIELGWYEQTVTTDTAPLPKWAEKGVISMLAQELRMMYPSSSLDPAVMDDSKNGFGMILRKAVIDAMEPADMSHMPAGSGRTGASDFDIESGNF